MERVCGPLCQWHDSGSSIVTLGCWSYRLPVVGRLSLIPFPVPASGTSRSCRRLGSCLGTMNYDPKPSRKAFQRGRHHCDTIIKGFSELIPVNMPLPCTYICFFLLKGFLCSFRLVLAFFGLWQGLRTLWSTQGLLGLVSGPQANLPFEFELRIVVS